MWNSWQQIDGKLPFLSVCIGRYDDCARDCFFMLRVAFPDGGYVDESRRTKFFRHKGLCLCPPAVCLHGIHCPHYGLLSFSREVYSLSSCTVKWRISGASHAILTPRVICSRRSYTFFSAAAITAMWLSV